MKRIAMSPSVGAEWMLWKSFSSGVSVVGAGVYEGDLVKT